ncbi:MAG: hypothetical protein L0G63_03155 [Psychrobacter sp.]|uniref:hypothetical protein n=1 Tax=Psychrobacter sp. TaxID=56811 RepID=UPI00264A1939|nr:hypothetical protein [Psychrobacter sp.]MDN5619431.1 hypothetical protein [Psychrobacter sp.]MDN5619471.1 hypothetical protein [Psychrobacter sp.]
MAEPITMQKFVNADVDVDTLEEAVNEDKVIVSRLGKEYASVPMASRLLVENGLLGATPFSTYISLASSALVDGDYAVVTNDTDLTKNGVYEKINGAWVYSKYNPVAQAEAVAETTKKNFETLFVEKSVSFDDNVLIAITDKVGNKTWLQANNEDGGLTKDAVSAVKKGVGLLDSDTLNGLMAITDRDGNLTDIWLDSSGQIHDKVMDNWHSRLATRNSDNNATASDGSMPDLVPKIHGSDSTTKKGDSYYKNGTLNPVYPDMTKMIVIGSSSAAGMYAEFLPKLPTLSANIELYSPATGGAMVEQMEALFGNNPLRLSFAGNKILASGVSYVSMLDDFPYQSALNKISGWVDGVYGSIGYTGEELTFTRAVAGDEVVVSDEVKIIPDEGNEFRNAVHISWIGKNNLTKNIPSVDCVGSLIRKTNSMFEYIPSMIKRIIVMTHFHDRDTPAVSEIRDRVNDCNERYKRLYGDAVFDVNQYILDPNIFDEIGFVRTPEQISADAAAQALGNKAPTLSRDNGHFNNETDEYITTKLIEFIQTKEWY